MKIIKITADMVFMLETDGTLPEGQKVEIIQQWAKIFPDNPILIIKSGTLSILQKDSSDSN